MGRRLVKWVEGAGACRQRGEIKEHEVKEQSLECLRWVGNGEEGTLGRGFAEQVSRTCESLDLG